MERKNKSQEFDPNEQRNLQSGQGGQQGGRQGGEQQGGKQGGSEIDREQTRRGTEKGTEKGTVGDESTRRIDEEVSRTGGSSTPGVNREKVTGTERGKESTRRAGSSGVSESDPESTGRRSTS